MLQSERVKITAPSRILKQKVGHGTIDKTAMLNAEKTLTKHATGFQSIATPLLADLKQRLKATKTDKKSHYGQARQRLVEPVMQLKANGAMFGFPIVSDLAQIMLNFLESIDRIDQDVIELLAAHHKTLCFLIERNMRTQDNATTTTFINELQEACRRYFLKKMPAPQN